MTATDYSRIERAINAGEVALGRHWRSLRDDQRDAWTTGQARDLWAEAFIAELGEDTGITLEQTARAWQAVTEWAGTRDVRVPPLGFAARLITELGLEISTPPREDVIAPVGQFSSTVVEAVARGLDPQEWERFDDPLYDGSPLDRRVRLVWKSLTAAANALRALEATGHLDADPTTQEQTP